MITKTVNNGLSTNCRPTGSAFQLHIHNRIKLPVLIANGSLEVSIVQSVCPSPSLGVPIDVYVLLLKFQEFVLGIFRTSKNVIDLMERKNGGTLGV